MGSPTLIIANRNYSSWSLRAWLAFEATGQPFDELVIPLGRPETTDEILHWSPTGCVPALHDGEIVLWDSLAICEHLAEAHPDAGLWPTDPRARAAARSVVESRLVAGISPDSTSLRKPLRSLRTSSADW